MLDLTDVKFDQSRFDDLCIRRGFWKLHSVPRRMETWNRNREFEDRLRSESRCDETWNGNYEIGKIGRSLPWKHETVKCHSWNTRMKRSKPLYPILAKFHKEWLEFQKYIYIYIYTNISYDQIPTFNLHWTDSQNFHSNFFFFSQNFKGNKLNVRRNTARKNFLDIFQK